MVRLMGVLVKMEEVEAVEKFHPLAVLAQLMRDLLVVIGRLVVVIITVVEEVVLDCNLLIYTMVLIITIGLEVAGEEDTMEVAIMEEVEEEAEVLIGESELAIGMVVLADLQMGLMVV